MSPRARWLPVCALAFLVALVLLNARGYQLFFDHRALDQRAFDYGWEFVLPWRALRGQWVGRDFIFPLGPAWQLLASLGSSADKVDAASFVAWMHVSFPLLSLLLVALLAWDASKDPRARAFLCLAMGSAAIHDDVRSFRAVLSLAVICFLLPGRLGGARRPLLTALLLVFACLTGIDTSVIAVASVIVSSGLLVLLVDRSVWLDHLASTWRTLAIAGAATALLLWALGFSGGKLWLDSWSSVRGYGTTLVRDPEGVWAYFALAVAVAQAGIALWLVSFRRTKVATLAAVLLLSALIPQARGVLRSNPEHLWAAMLPGLGALLLVSATAELRADVRRATSAVSLSVLCLWLSLDSARMNAWSYSQWARGLGEADEPAAPNYESDFSRVLRYLEEHPEHACLTLPERLIAVHALSGKSGPSVSANRWSPEDADALVNRIGESHARCPLVISEIRSFDLPPRHHGSAFDANRLAIASPERLIGPNLVVAVARPSPAITTQELELAPMERHMAVPGMLSIPLSRPIPGTSALELSYQLDLSNWRLLMGGAPWMEVQFFSGDRPLAPATEVPSLAFNRIVRTWVPVHPEAAEWRFGFGRDPTAAELHESADRVVVSLHSRHTSPSRMALRIVGLREGTAPARRRNSGGCRRSQDLREDVKNGTAMSRALTPRVDGDRLLVPPNPAPEALAEVFVPVTPCENSCLYGEVGIDHDSGAGAELEVHAVDGFERPRLLGWRAQPGHAPRPFQLPLGQYAGKPILIRLGSIAVGAQGQGRAAFTLPRIEECASLVSVVHQLQDGRLEILRGDARVSGDTLQMRPTPQREAPAEVRVPLRLPQESCLAVDLSIEATQTDRHQDLEVGVLHAGEYVVLAKGVVGGEKRSRHFLDLPLKEWWRKDVQLRFLARAAGDRGDSWGVFARPRVHRCGDGAPWAFGPRAVETH